MLILNTKGIERIFMKKFICAVLSIALFCLGVSAPLPSWASEPAWNEIWDPNMVNLVGSDGQKYYTSKDYWILYYHQDGSTTYQHTAGGTLQKKLRIACYDGTIQTVYCIGTGLAYQYGGDKYQKEDLNIPNDYFERLPESAKQGIYLTLLFGYEDGRTSPVPGTNEDDYWIATQALIWEYQQGLRKGPDELQDNGPVRQNVYFDIVRNRPAERCYQWILNSIRDYLTFPSFLTPDSILYEENHVAVQHEKDGLYTLELYDDHHTEDALVVGNAQGEALDWVEIIHLGESKYRLQTTKAVKEPITLYVQKVVPQGHKKSLYFSDGSGKTQVVTCRSTQSTAARDVRPLTISTQDYVEAGNIRITKYAEKGSLVYAFKLQGLEPGNVHVCKTVYTDLMGQSVLESIPVGAYEICEILPEESPWKQPEAQRVFVTDRQTTEVVFQNILKRGALTINKTFEGRNTPWPGIKFEVTGTYQGEIVYQREIIADATGNCVLTGLPIGQYEICELPVGQEAFYELSGPVNVEIIENQTTEVAIYNRARKAQLLIEKTGEVIVSSVEEEGMMKPITQQKPLDGAVFEIYAEADICAEDGTLRVPKGSLVDTVCRNKGTYRSCLLYPGVYRIRESVCPKGYMPCKEQVVSLEAHQDLMVRIENALLSQQVCFVKELERGTPEQMQQVLFGLFADEDIKLLDGTVILKGQLLDKGFAQVDGVVELQTLFPNSVYVQEIDTASGYVLDPNLYPVVQGVIHNGAPLMNHLIPKNPKTGEMNSRKSLFYVCPLAVCVFGIVAFYRKSRYNN